MTPCSCGCGTLISPRRRAGGVVRFVSGHNARGRRYTRLHRRRISIAQRRAWKTRVDARKVGDVRVWRGYVYVKTSDRRGSARWRKQHVLVVETKIGRRLNRGEVVHHINGVSTDNRRRNLFLCESVTAHSKIHATFGLLLSGLMKDGIVRFDRRKRAYLRAA